MLKCGEGTGEGRREGGRQAGRAEVAREGRSEAARGGGIGRPLNAFSTKSRLFTIDTWGHRQYK